jgi:outer membrane immunogenic protein
MTSKLILSAAVVVSAILGIHSASAADMAVKARPSVAPAPVFTWTGCYIGAHAGAGVVRDQGFEQNGLIQTTFVDAGLADRGGIGGLAGGQAGCNYQTGMLVLGIEGEGFWSGMKITRDAFEGTTQFATASIRNKWDYDVAGRIGVAFDRALVYGKAGWVWGGFDWDARFVNFCGLTCPVTTGSTTLDGLLIGVGLEYAFLNNWTVKFEYDYLGFGSKNVNFVTVVPAQVAFTQTQNVSADKHIFKVGLNYLFNLGGPAVAARY